MAVTDPRLAPEAFWGRLRRALAEVPADVTRPPPDARVGAVLVLLEETAEGPQVVLTRRRRDLRSHPGQLSFPGGRLDPGESVEEAALREAKEEIGLRAHTVEVVGVGPTFYIPPSRFWVVPVLGRWRQPHELTENPWEVDSILHVPLAELLEADRWRRVPLSASGASWAWQLEDDLLWGATAVVMGLLLDVAVEDWSGGTRPEDLSDDRAVHPWEEAPSVQRRVRLTGELPEAPQAEVPHATEDQVRILRAWLDRHGVGPLARAEQAGRALAHAVRRLRDDDVAGVEVTLLLGPSSNGAAGAVAGRLLCAAGAVVDAVVVDGLRHPEQVALLEAGGARVVPVTTPEALARHAPGELVVDALLGVGARPPLDGMVETAAEWLRRFDVPVVAADLPSGIAADSGLHGPCVNADVTVALGVPVRGLQPKITQPYVGDLYLADLGIPVAAWQEAGLPAPAVFGRGPLVRLTVADHASDAGTPDQGRVAG